MNLIIINNKIHILTSNKKTNEDQKIKMNNPRGKRYQGKKNPIRLQICQE